MICSTSAEMRGLLFLRRVTRLRICSLVLQCTHPTGINYGDKWILIPNLSVTATISAKEGGYCLSVRSVCYQLYIKTTERIFVKILPEMCIWLRKIPFNFGSHTLRDPDLGIFEGFFNTARSGIFPQFACSYRWKS